MPLRGLQLTQSRHFGRLALRTIVGARGSVRRAYMSPLDWSFSLSDPASVSHHCNTGSFTLWIQRSIMVFLKNQLAALPVLRLHVYHPIRAPMTILRNAVALLLASFPSV